MRISLLFTTIVSIPLALATATLAANPDHLQRLLKTNQCVNCDLSGANLEDTNLFGASLVGANLTGANLKGANLGSANLTETNLTGAKLNNANLYLATLDTTNLSQADLSNAYLREAVLSETKFQGATLRGVNLSRTNLSGVNFQNVDLSGANLNRAAFIGFPGKDSGSGNPYSGFFTAAQLSQAFCTPDASSDSFNLNDIKQAGMELANLNGANLSGANLTKTLLIGTELNSANLGGANLTNACLFHAKLKNAVLDGANLKGATFQGAILENASVKNVQNADFKGSYKTEAEAIAAPRQTEAKQYIGYINSGQQTFFLDKSKFATNLDDLGLGVPGSTDFYNYQILPQKNANKSAIAVAKAKVSGLRSYTGAVFVVKDANSKQSITVSAICESEQPTTTPPAAPNPPKNSGEAIKCPTGSKLIEY
jgi:uncharacterized protein YjbI with pentapeptide repeats